MGNIKVQRKNINKFVLDILIDFVGEVERRPRNMWITQKMLKEERKYWKNVNNVE
jgi:hypothetical protein